jgi:cytochrome oxidase assembly protein ShyY1
MWALLRTPRWSGFTAVAVLAIIGFGFLSFWQWNRAEEKQIENTTVLTNTQAVATPLDEALTSPAEWERVRVSGEFGNEQYLVRNRPQSGTNGFWVVAPLISDGTALPDGEVAWVARGWTRQQTAANIEVAAPPVPRGEVVVEGYLRPTSSAPARPSQQYPVGQIAVVNTTDLTALIGVDMDPALSGWYVQAADGFDSDTNIEPLPLPQADVAMNLSYAGQWLLFAAIAVGGWYYFLRREAKDQIRSLDINDCVEKMPSNSSAD